MLVFQHQQDVFLSAKINWTLPRNSVAWDHSTLSIRIGLIKHSIFLEFFLTDNQPVEKGTSTLVTVFKSRERFT